MIRIPDSTLVAYVDDELDADTAREVEAAIAADPEMGRKAELLRLSGSIAREAFHAPEYEHVSPLVAQKLAGIKSFQKTRSRLSWRLTLRSWLS